MSHLPVLDLTAPGFSTRSAEVIAARKAHWCARTPFGLAILRHRQAGLLLRDRRLRQGSYAWTEQVGLKGAFSEFWRRSVIAQEGASHKALRLLVQKALAEDHIVAMKPSFCKIAEDLCDDAEPLGQFDIVDQFTEPFAGRAIAMLIGRPLEQASQISKDASALGLAMGPDAKRYEAISNTACERLSQMAEEMLLARPDDGFVGRLMDAAAEAGGVDRQDLVDLIVIAIFGGVDTTRAQLAFAAWLFAQHPQQWAWLRENLDSIPTALDEVIRMRPTTTWATREALEDFEFEGVALKQGETVHILVHASGTDPATGHDGGFDIRRPTKGHFGFGGGAHHCLGHFVARTDMSAALEVWLRRWRAIDVVGTPEFMPDAGNTSPISLMVRPDWSG